jgi:hypothetical protein
LVILQRRFDRWRKPMLIKYHIMEPTLTQNGALYRAQHRISKRRFGLFRHLGVQARLQPPDIQRRTFADAHVSRRFHPDNGR